MWYASTIKGFGYSSQNTCPGSVSLLPPFPFFYGSLRSRVHNNIKNYSRYSILEQPHPLQKPAMIIVVFISIFRIPILFLTLQNCELSCNTTHILRSRFIHSFSAYWIFPSIYLIYSLHLLLLHETIYIILRNSTYNRPGKED